MIYHLALFSFNKDTSAVIRTKLIKQLKQLPSYIPEVKSFHVGKDFAHRQTCYEYGLVSEFEKKSDLENYLANPVHQELLQRAIPYLGKFAEVDFEI